MVYPSEGLSIWRRRIGDWLGNALEFEDAKRIWLGLSIMAGQEFDPGEDVSRLLGRSVAYFMAALCPLALANALAACR
jgi:hypothetical protein